MTSVRNLLQYGISKLQSKVPDATSSARYLLEHAINCRELNLSRVVTSAQRQQYESYLDRRLQREPVQYIIGNWDFDVLANIICRPPVLIPRPETEELVMLADRHIKEHQDVRHFLEIGCGSGAISIALLRRNPGLQGTALDISSGACALTTENAARFGVSDRLHIVNNPMETFVPAAASSAAAPPQFDLLVSNPPYIDQREYDVELEAEVKTFEDKRALVGGQPFGAGFLISMLRQAAREQWLKSNAAIFLETHYLHPSLFSYLYHKKLPLECPPVFQLASVDRPPNPGSVAELAAALDVDEAAVETCVESCQDLRVSYDLLATYADFSLKPRFLQLRYARG